MTNRQFCERAYLRACSLAKSGSLSDDLASRTTRGNPFESRRRKSMKPSFAFSKSSPSASSSPALIETCCLQPDVRRLVSLWEEAPASLFQQPVDSYAGGSFVHVLWRCSVVRISLYCSRQSPAPPASWNMLSSCWQLRGGTTWATPMNGALAMNLLDTRKTDAKTKAWRTK